MRAITLENAGYVVRDIPIPQPQVGEVLIKVAYAGVNRADLFQKQGRYPAPLAIPAVPGLEVSGEIAACGEQVEGFAAGEPVCALLSEGAFAEYACVPVGQVLPVPAGLSLAQAAALPEACFTAWISLVWQARLRAGESVLIHGGASGIGTMTIQVARALGGSVFSTAGTAEKCAACAALGAVAIHYRSESFEQVIRERTQGRGVDVILDMIGGECVARNLAALAQGGRLCIIAFLEGAKLSLNLAPVLLRHLSIMGSTLRARSSAEKAALAAEIREKLWPLMGQKNGINPMIYKIYDMDEAEKALAVMEQRLNIGKILLKI